MAINKRFASEEYVNENYAPISHPHSWADSGDKITYGDTLTWDGNTEGLETNQYVGYKLTNIAPTLSDVEQGVIATDLANGASVQCEVVTITDTVYALQFGGVETPQFVVVTEDTTENGITATKGFYSTIVPEHPMKLTINGFNGFETTETVPLPNKYLPEHLQFGEKTTYGDTATFDGDLTGRDKVSVSGDGEYYFVKVSDTVPTLEDLQNGVSITLTSGTESQTLEITTDAIVDGGNFIIENNDMFFVIAKEDNTDVDGTIFPSKGIYALYFAIDGAAPGYVSAFTINGYNGFKTTEIKTIDSKYIDIPNILEEVNTHTLSIYDVDLSKRYITPNGFVHVSDVVFDPATLTNDCYGEFKHAISTEADSGLKLDFLQTATGVYCMCWGIDSFPIAILAMEDNVSDVFDSYSKKGIYFFNNHSNGTTVSITVPDVDFTKNQVKNSYASPWSAIKDKPFDNETDYYDSDTLYSNNMYSGGWSTQTTVAPTYDEMLQGITVYARLSGDAEYKEYVFPTDENTITVEGNGYLLKVNNIELVRVESDKVFFQKIDTGRDVKYMTVKGFGKFPRKGKSKLPNKYLDFIETVGGDTLTWDGNTEGLISVLDTYFLVSNTVPSLTDLQAGGVLTPNDGETLTFNSDSVLDCEASGMGANCIVIASEPSVFIALKDGAVFTMEGDSITFEKSGVYFPCMPAPNGIDDTYITKFTINGYTGFTKEQVKEEYLPELNNDNRFIVNVNLEGSTLVSDKTFDEIVQAKADCKDIEIHHGEYVIREYRLSSNTLEYFYIASSSDAIQIYDTCMNSDGEITAYLSTVSETKTQIV